MVIIMIVAVIYFLVGLVVGDCDLDEEGYYYCSDCYDYDDYGQCVHDSTCCWNTSTKCSTVPNENCAACIRKDNPILGNSNSSNFSDSSDSELKGNAGEYYANGTGNSSSSLSSCRDKDVGCSNISGIMYY
jgi:hypothetical protein